MSSMRLGGKAVPTASEGYTEDHKFRARLADRYEIMANCKKKLKTAFFFHTVFCLTSVAFALLSMNNEKAFSIATPPQMLMFVSATLVFSPALPLIIINKKAAKASTGNGALYFYIVCAQLVALAQILAAGWHVITPYARMTGYHEQAWMGAVNLLAFGAGINVMGIYYTYQYVLQSNRPKSG